MHERKRSFQARLIKYTIHICDQKSRTLVANFEAGRKYDLGQKIALVLMEEISFFAFFSEMKGFGVKFVII